MAKSSVRGAAVASDPGECYRVPRAITKRLLLTCCGKGGKRVLVMLVVVTMVIKNVAGLLVTLLKGDRRVFVVVKEVGEEVRGINRSCARV